MTFTVLIVSIEQNEEFQESRVHYTLAGIKSLLKIGERGRGFLDARGGVLEPLEPSPGYAPRISKLFDNFFPTAKPWKLINQRFFFFFFFFGGGGGGVHFK